MGGSVGSDGGNNVEINFSPQTPKSYFINVVEPFHITHTVWLLG
jgi:hypothetical protein